MDQSLYNYSLCIALPLLLFFGFNMLFARVPEKQKFSNFLRSRRMMGVALLILAANYAVHFFCGIRLKALNMTILVDMTTYFLCYWLFSAALMTLLVENYVTKGRVAVHLSLWLAYLSLAAAERLLPVDACVWATRALAAVLVIYGIFLTIRLLRTYRRAIRLFENTHSDDIGAYIRWLSVFTYWATAFGVSCALLTFLPDKYVFLWILAAIPFYIYLFCCYQNYIFFHEQVKTAIQDDEGMMDLDGEVQAVPEERRAGVEDTKAVPVYHSDIAQRMEAWLENEGYRKPGLTLNELSLQLCTNRTYLSEYINTVYHKSFRDWITDLRIGAAKQLMLQNPDLKMQEVSELAGFLSLSHFSRTFREKEGCSPAKWRKDGPQQP
ncbi:MAG: helix-turn-helix domain-containing protein, partial [Candidatus Cryptobacteroides sp.]